MSVVLLYPPRLERKFTNPFVSEPSLPPLGILSVAAFLEQSNIKVKVIDASIMDLSFSQLIKLLRKLDPPIIGITAQTQDIHRGNKLANLIKKELKECYVIFGGPHPTALPEETLKACSSIDFVVIGEGELTTLDLVKALQTNDEIENIQGIGFRKNHIIKINPPRKCIENIDTLPFPARHLIPLFRYKPNPLLFRTSPVTSAIFSRGCPYHCKFCSKNIWGSNLRERSADKVFEEIEHLRSNCQIKEIIFLDDIFTINKKRVIKICDKLEKNKIDLSWSCISRVDCVDRALLEKMKRAGCHQVAFGVESGNQDILNYINKRITIKQIERAFKIAQQVGLETRAYFMIGFPSETKSMSYQTIKFAKKLNPDYAYFYIFVPYPGTEFWDILKNRGDLADTDWKYFSRWVPNYLPTNRTKKEIRQTFKAAYRLFYLRSNYIFNQVKSIKNFNKMRKNIELLLQYLRGMTL